MSLYHKLIAWISALSGTSEFKNRKRLADHLNVQSPSKLYQALEGKRVPAADTFISWLDTLGAKVVLPDELRMMESEFYPVPKVKARLAGSHGGSLVREDSIEDFYAFQYKWLSRRSLPARCVLMDVVGDSMYPTLQDGDMALVDQGQTEVYAGKIYAVGIEDTIVVKRLEKQPNKLVLRSDNSVYEPLSLPLRGGDDAYDNGVSDYHIIGRVIWVAREFK